MPGRSHPCLQAAEGAGGRLPGMTTQPHRKTPRMIRLTASPFLHRWFYRFLLAVVVALQASTPSRAVAALPGLTHVDSLNGAWSFRYVEGLDAGEVHFFHQPGFDVSDWASIKVPANWELEGFAEPRYALKLADGLGLYRRTFEVDPE